MSNLHYPQFCALARAAELIGERWTLLIIRELLLGPERFGDLLDHLDGIISKAGTKDLPLGLESIAGFTIVSAESIDDAEKIAQSNPYISSIRVYEVMSK